MKSKNPTNLNLQILLIPLIMLSHNHKLWSNGAMFLTVCAWDDPIFYKLGFFHISTLYSIKICSICSNVVYTTRK